MELSFEKLDVARTFVWWMEAGVRVSNQPVSILLEKFLRCQIAVDDMARVDGDPEDCIDCGIKGQSESLFTAFIRPKILTAVALRPRAGGALCMVSSLAPSKRAGRIAKLK